MNVFISYSSRDRREALAIRRLLEEHDCVVWLDAFDIVASKNLRDQLLSNIARSDLFCLLLSPTSVSSNWVEQEIEEAFRPRTTQQLQILPIILRPCRIPERLQHLPAFRVHEVAEGYKGLDDEAVRLQLVRRVFGAATVSDVTLDDAMRKSLADQAEQLEAAGAMVQLARELERLRGTPFRDVELHIDARAFEGSIYDENPFVLELRLMLNPLFTAPLSFFVAPFKEGHTWPAVFGFDEPPYTRFRPDQRRLDCKLKWYERVEDVRGIIDGTELGLPLAGFSMQFDGAQWQPKASKPSRFGPSIPPLAVNYEIPSLDKLIADKCHFQVILHRIKTETADEVDPTQTDIAVQLVGRLSEFKTDVTLFKMPNTELETVLLFGDYLSHIASPIERAAILGQYSTSTDDRLETRKRIHHLSIARREIDWDDDRRLVARLLDTKNALFALRGHQIKILEWETVPGDGVELLREFLLHDFDQQSYFAYLVFDDRAQIEGAHIEKTADGNIEIRAPGRAFRITPVAEEYRAEATATEGTFTGSTLHNFMLLEEKSRLSLFVSNRMDLVYGCVAIQDLLGPIVFERLPSFADGYLFEKSSAQLFKHFIAQKLWSSAKDIAENGVNAARKLVVRDPNEDAYKRWEAESLERLGTAELKLANVDSAVKGFIASVQLFRDLYQSVPTVVRMTDLLSALGRMSDRSVENRLPVDTGPLQAEISALQLQRQKIISFADGIGAEYEGRRTDVLSQMADQLEVSRGSGTRSGEGFSGSYSITFAKPRGELSTAQREAFDHLLRPTGFEWTQTWDDVAKRFEGSWQQWLAADAESTRDGKTSRS